MSATAMSPKSEDKCVTFAPPALKVVSMSGAAKLQWWEALVWLPSGFKSIMQ